MAKQPAVTVPLSVPRKSPRRCPGLEEALNYAYRADIRIDERGGELIFQDPHRQLKDWLRDALITHKSQIIWQIGMGRKITYLYDRIRDLRYHESAFKGLDRRQSIERVSGYIEAFEGDCDLPDGYTDPGDCWADCCLSCLHHDFAEMTHPQAPYPVPPGDPRPRAACRSVVDGQGREIKW